MNVLKNFSIFYGKDQHQSSLRFILKFPEISQRKLSNFQKIIFQKLEQVSKTVRIKNMLSQESQKMCFECSVAIKCEILKNFKIQTFKIYKFKLKFKLLNVLTHQNSTWDFWTLQTLFPPLKIDIFCRIVPLSFIENSSKLSLKFLDPANAVSSFENWHFLLHRPPYFSLRIWNESSWKNLYPANADSPFENRHFLTHRPPIISPCSPLTMRTCSPLTMRRPPPIGSPHRGILCVEKIGSAAPELQEWPGAPSKPVKSTNGPFYWLTRKRAPPLWGDPCGGTPVGGLV